MSSKKQGSPGAGNAEASSSSKKTPGLDSGNSVDSKERPRANGHTILEPDRDQLATFVRTLFKYAYPGTWVSLRSFYEDCIKVYKINCVRADDLEAVIEEAIRHARLVANAKPKLVFAPPVATFNNSKTARKEDVVDGVALDAEIDKAPQAARATLEKLLGPATIVVELGGEWTNPETGKLEPKLHLHWRLKKPARGSERELLEEARKIVIAMGGSDPTHGPISHPIRWPGSWHRKGEPKLCRIIKVNEEREIDLHAALTALRKVAPAKPGQNTDSGEASDEPNWGELIQSILTAENYHEPQIELAAKLVKSGMNGGAAVNLIRGWMEASSGPRDNRWQSRFDDIPRSVSTAEDLIEEEQKAEVETPEIILQPHDFPDEKTIPRWDFLYGRHLLRKTVSGTAAMGSTGKTSMSLVEALSMTSGKELLGEEVPENPLRVLLICLEDNREAMNKRIAAAMKHHKLKPLDIGDRLFVIAKGEIKFKIVKQVRGTTKPNTELIEQIIKFLRDKKIDVFSIDPFIKTHGVPENDNTGISDVVECYDDIAEQANCAVSLWHHTRKGNSLGATVDSARGASSFIDACRSVRVLETMTKEEGAKQGIDKPKRAFRSFSGKLNFAPSTDKSTWYWLASVPILNGDGAQFMADDGNGGDDVGVVEAWELPSVAEVELTAEQIDAIKTAVASGEWRESPQAGMWVGKAIAPVLKLDAENDKPKLKTFIKTLIEDQHLKVVPGRSSKRHQVLFVVVAPQRKKLRARTR